MGRRRTWEQCDTPGCEGEFYARREEGSYLCKKCYMREYQRDRRRTMICNKRGCTESVECIRLDYYHCRYHHNQMFHELSSPFYLPKEVCGCTGLGRYG